MVCSIYHPPNTAPALFTEELEWLANALLKQKTDWIIGTDHNMDFLKVGMQRNTQQFIDMLLECRMTPTITCPTRISKTSATLIDNILVTQWHCKRYESCVLIDDLSDHLPCLLQLKNFKTTKKHEVYIETRDIRTKSLNCLNENLAHIDCSCIFEKNNNKTASDKFETFHTELMRQVNNFCPIRKRKIPKKELRKEQWVTGGLLRSIRHSKSLYKASIKCNATDTDRTKYHNYS